VSQLNTLLCGSPESNNATGIKWGWYCKKGNYANKLLTGVVPPLVLTFWQGIVVPRWFYYWTQVCIYTKSCLSLISVFTQVTSAATCRAAASPHLLAGHRSPPLVLLLDTGAHANRTV